MLFNSLSFLIFFPLAVCGYYLIPRRLRYLWLLGCSYYFYMNWNPAYALLLLASTGITWLSGLALERAKGQGRGSGVKKLCVAVCAVLNIAILCYFKYANFLGRTVNFLLNTLHCTVRVPPVDVLLPVGISFYIFQALSYSVDVYRDEIGAERNFFRYALFVSFFPQLVAGPIERSKNLLNQLREDHPFSFDNLRGGFMQMLWGYFLKIVAADRIAAVVDAVYGDIGAYPGWYLILATVLFAVQIYCDFAGYSTIAMGAARIMGFRLMDNFNAPYFAATVAEFWRRWHISLSSWFRDYVYIPLGGSRKGTLRKYRNLMIVFLLSGLWHGASWSFVVWGGLNGIYQIVGSCLKPVRERLWPDRPGFLRRAWKSVVTFCLIDLSWVFFRADSLRDALRILKSIFTAGNVAILWDGSLAALGLDGKKTAVLLVSLGLILLADALKYKGVPVRQRLCAGPLWLRWLVLIGGVLAILTFGVWGSGYNAASFIYFQF